MKKHVCITLTQEEHEALQAIAKREHRTVSNLIEAWIAEDKETTQRADS